MKIRLRRRMPASAHMRERAQTRTGSSADGAPAREARDSNGLGIFLPGWACGRGADRRGHACKPALALASASSAHWQPPPGVLSPACPLLIPPCSRWTARRLENSRHVSSQNAPPQQKSKLDLQMLQDASASMGPRPLPASDPGLKRYRPTVVDSSSRLSAFPPSSVASRLINAAGSLGSIPAGRALTRGVS